MQKLMKNKKIVLLSGIIGVVCIVYLLLCLFVQSQDFLRNTTINGIDVANMTKEEAIQAVESLGKGVSIRGEALSLEEFAKIANYILEIRNVNSI